MTHDCCSNVKPQTDTSHPPAGGTDERGNKTVYSCPMPPEVRSERPELCPECGMALLPVKGEKLSARRSPSPAAKVKRASGGPGGGRGRGRRGGPPPAGAGGGFRKRGVGTPPPRGGDADGGES